MTTRIVHANNDDDDEQDGGLPPKPNGFVNQKVALAHHFYLSGPIKGPSEYMPMFEFIRNAGENDLVVFHINSEGGSLFSAIQFLRVMAETKATVLASVEGACMSAATVIFLAAHMFEVSNHSMFMFHNYSGGAFGKGNEMHEQIVFERMWSQTFFKDIYKDFLTDDEMAQLLNGKDYWMTGEEVGERLLRRKELRAKAAETQIAAATEAKPEEAPVPPKASKVSTKRKTRSPK